MVWRPGECTKQVKETWKKTCLTWMNFTQQDATKVPTCALTSLKIYRIMLVIGIGRNTAKSTGKEMNKSLWKSYISFQEQSNHQIRAVWKSKINGWRLETWKGRDFRYNDLWKMLISQLFLVQIRICRMWILQYGKQDTSKKPSVQFFSMFFCVSSQQRAFNGDFNVCFTAPNLVTIPFNQFIFGCQKTCTVLCIIFTFSTSLIIFDVEYYTNWTKRPLFIRFSGPRAVQAQLACLGHVADSAVGRLEKETGLVPAAVARDFQRTVSKVAFPGLKKRQGFRSTTSLKILKYIIHLLYFTIFVYDNCKFDFRLNIMVEHSTKMHKVTARLHFCWLYGTANSGMPKQTWTEDCLYENSPPSLQRRNLLRLGQLLPSWWVNTTQTYLTLEIFETNALFI